MEQTSIFDETLVSRISNMTIFDQFAQTIFVEHNTGMIEVESSYRESNIFFELLVPSLKSYQIKGIKYKKL